MKNKLRRLLYDIFIFAIGSLGSKMILFLLVPLYTNCLSKEEYGTSELVFTIAQLLIPIVSVTIHNGIIRFGLMRDKKTEDVLAAGFLIWLFSSVLTVFITPLFYYYTPISRWKWYLCVYCIVFILVQIELNYIKVKGQNKLFSIVSVFQTVILAILNIILLSYLDIGIKGYLISNIFANILAAIATFVLSGIYKDLKKAKIDVLLIKQMLVYSVPLVLNDVSWWFIHSSDKIMVEFMVGAAALGLYTVAAKIPGLVNTFVDIFSQAWGVSAIKEIESSDDKQFYSEVFRIYSAFSFGASIFFIAVIKPFMLVYVSDDFTGAWRYVPLLLVAASFSAISAFFGSMFGALKKSIHCMWTTVIGGVVNVLLNFIFISAFGVWGAIIGTVAAYMLISFLRLFDVIHFIKMNIYWWQFVVDIVIVMAQAIIVSFGWHIYMVSVIAIVFFFCNHFDMLVLLSRILWKRISS